MAVFITFLAVVALAFAATDITGSTFGGISGGDRVAVVGDDEITTSELTSTAQSAIAQVRRENPTVTMPDFIADGGLDEVLQQLIDRYAIGAYAELAGLRAGDNLINSEILQIPAFRGVSGEFDQQAYQSALAQQRITDAILRRDLADGLLAQQMILPALAAPQMPGKAARQYASLLLERRNGRIALVPSALFVSEKTPSPAAVQAYYTENRSDYIEPERRTLRYAVISADNLNTSLEPTDAEIAARYKANAAQYAASETRDVTSFFVPTEEGAKAIVQQIRGGKSLEAAARDAGFNTTSVEGRDQEQYASGTSFAVAQAVFAANQGAIATPARSTLGWYIARVDKITKIPARSLADARSETAEQITNEKRGAALADLSSRIEEQVDVGTSLTEIAADFDLTLENTPPLLADGRVFGSEQAQPNPALRPVLDTAFALDESQPQLDELVPGSQFLVYDVVEIVESAAPPLAEIKEEVSRDLARANAAKEAKKAAQRILKKARGGMSLADAIAAETVAIPAPDAVSLERRELLQAQPGQNVPPALVLLFSMAKGTVKLLEAPANQGWILVDLEEIDSQILEEGNPLLAQARQQLAPALSNEYSAQLTKAMREQVGVETNESAIEAVRAQLAGGN
ncbi:MAG: SurA N-terminal domain-containing protein [Erythrobacter sp.]